MADRTVRLRSLGPTGARERLRSRDGDPADGAGLLARVRALEVRPQVVGPHARLGVVWFAVSMLALVAGRLAFALLMAGCAGLAAVQAARSWRVRPRPAVPVAGGGAVALVLAAVAGPVAVGVTAAVVAGVVVAGAAAAGERRADPVVTLLIAGTVGLAAASPVLLLHRGVSAVFVLLVFAAVHDASAYVVGTGARNAWEGPAAGAASIAAVTLGVAAVLVPPFRGASPWILGGVAIVLAPVGPYVGSALLGRRGARVPALRRLDSLLVLAPVWSLVAVVVLESPAGG